MAIVKEDQYADRTKAINAIPFQPNLLTSLGLFNEETVTSDVVTFDERNHRLVVLDDKLRNTDKKNGIDASEYKTHLLHIPHYPVEDVITVRQLKGIRNFDSDVEPAIESAVAENLEHQTKTHDNHLEFLQAMMVTRGKVITENYGEIDMFDEFGVTKVEENITFSGNTPLESQFRAITNAAKKSYKGGRSRGFVVLCGATFFDHVVTHPDIKEQFALVGQPNQLIQEVGNAANGYQSFQFGNITFIQYDDVFTLADGSSEQPLADDKAVLMPRGVMGSTFFGPVSKLSGIGQEGAKRFASSYRDPKDRYVEVESEQNTLVVLQEIGAVAYLGIQE